MTALNLRLLQARLWQVGQLLPQGLARHMEAQGALPVLYASSWLLTAFASDMPLYFASRVMDCVLADCYLEPMMKVGCLHLPADVLDLVVSSLCCSL